MKREFMYGDYTIVESNDRVPFTAWLGTEHLGDYHTQKGAAARCDRHKRTLKHKAEAHLDYCSKFLGL